MKILSVAVMLLASVSMADECSSRWEMYGLGPKPLLGDTEAIYAVYAFRGNPKIRLEIRGKAPVARFWSFETEATSFIISEDHIFGDDVQLEADGSYRIVASQAKSDTANYLALPNSWKSRLQQAIMFRNFVPGEPFNKEDLPKIYATDLDGNPAPCPKPSTRDPEFHFPSWFANVATWFLSEEFRPPPSMGGAAGLNSAITYQYALVKAKPSEKVHVRFKAHTREQVRYWSVCSVSFPKNRTYECVSDVQMPGAKGIAQIDFAHQGVLQLVIRNLLPMSGFTPFASEYKPVVVKE